MNTFQSLKSQLANLPGWSYIAAGVAVVILIVFIGRFLGRRKPQEADYSMPNLAPQTSTIPTKGDERRSCQRRSGNPTPVLISSDSGQPSEGEVIDRSAGGLCLLVPKEIARGTLLKIRPAQVPANIPWVRVEVRHCRSGSEGCFIGCRFVEQPPMNVLLLFG